VGVLPSKKLIIVFTITVIVGTGFFFSFQTLREKTVLNQQTNNNGIVAETISAEGNKTLSPFENLTGSASVFEGDYNSDNTEGSLNLTESLSQELLISLESKEGGSVSESEIGNAVQNLLKKMPAREEVRVYTIENILVIEDTQLNLKIYGNNFIDAIKKHPSANANNVFGIFEELLTTKNTKNADSLSLIENEYRDLEIDLMAIKIPQSVASDHVDFLNGLHLLTESVSDMKTAIIDPVRGSVGLSVYVKQLEQQLNILLEIKRVFETKNVMFEKTESGYGWNFVTK